MKRFLPLLFLPWTLLAADYPTLGKIERLDPALDKLIPADAKIEKLCEGITWSEGPVWMDGALLFSDVPKNIAYRWKEGATVAEVFLQPSGQMTPQPGFRESGSNGLAVDPEGRLVLCEDGERCLARLETEGRRTILADRFEGKRFNSPNDLAYRHNGDLYFTDPPYGLEGGLKSPLKELPYSGVFRIEHGSGRVTLLTKDLLYPNGIAFSPRETVLYVGVTDPGAPRIMAYPVTADGGLGEGRVFFDGNSLPSGQEGSCDGMKVDAQGNIFSSGPGGLLVLSPEGKHLGTITTGTVIANCAWGDDGSTLYMTCNHMICRLRTSTHGDKRP